MLILLPLATPSALATGAEDAVCIDWVPVVERGPSVSFGRKCIKHNGIPEDPLPYVLPQIEHDGTSLVIRLCWDGPEHPCVTYRILAPPPPRVEFGDGVILICSGSTCRQIMFTPIEAGREGNTIYVGQCGPSACDRKEVKIPG